MRPLETTEAGDRHPGSVTSTLKIADQSSREIARQTTAAGRHVLDVPALAFRPSGRRFGWLWLVTRCPYCSEGAVASAHSHRGGPIGGVRQAGCGLGEYRLVRVDRGWAV